MARPDAAPTKNRVKKLTVPEFIRQYIKMQTELMDGMVQMMVAGDIRLEDENADAVIDAIMGQWMAEDDPDFTSQMQAQAAMFLDELLEALYAAQNGGDDRYTQADASQPHASAGPTAATITLDVLKTIRSVWGKS